MPMKISITINGTDLGTAEVINRGPVDGVYADGDHSLGGGVRRYEWRLEGEVRAGGEVLHARTEGAWALAQKVAEAISTSQAERERLAVADIVAETWVVPRCAHGHILLGCPHDDCAEQNAYLAEQNAAVEAHLQRQQDEARKIVRESLGLPLDEATTSP